MFLVLGSGLSGLTDGIDGAVSVPFSEIHGFPRTSVPGHEGRFVSGRLGGVPVLVQSGRFHAYEGHPLENVTLPVRVASALGAGVFVATNAAGGICPEFSPGDLVLIEDHVNFMFRNPLVGPVVSGEERFPDMSEPYDADLRSIARDAAREQGLSLRSGVYAAVLGPSYETAAEVRLLASLGVDLVGMSTVPEVLVARARGMRCLAVSMVTNAATGVSSAPVTHHDVLEVGERAGARLAALLTAVMERIGKKEVNRDG